MVVATLKGLGWIINKEKSSLGPSQDKLFWRYLVDSRSQSLFLPWKMIEKIVSLVRTLGEGPMRSRRDIVRVLGLMTVNIPAVT